MKENKTDYSRIPKMTEYEFVEFIREIIAPNSSIDFLQLRRALKDRYPNSKYAYELFNYIIERREKNASNVRDSTYLNKPNKGEHNRKHKLCRMKNKTFTGKIRRVINKLLLKIRSKKKQIEEDEHLR